MAYRHDTNRFGPKLSDYTLPFPSGNSLPFRPPRRPYQADEWTIDLLRVVVRRINTSILKRTTDCVQADALFLLMERTESRSRSPQALRVNGHMCARACMCHGARVRACIQKV